jgi:hypothetical protein
MSTTQIHKVSKGVSKIVLKFPHKNFLPYQKLRSSFTSLPFHRKGLLIIPVDLIPCRQSIRPFSNQLFSDQISRRSRSFVSSQGSRKVNVEKSSIVFPSRSVLITFISSESITEVNPRSIETFGKLLLLQSQT